jgi:hypothetical protein
MSSMSFGSRPSKNGLRYCSIAVTTVSGRWVKVAQPRPYSPGSLVSTFTTTRRMPSGAVQIARTSAILSAGIPPDGSQAGRTAGSIDPTERGSDTVDSSPRLAGPLGSGEAAREEYCGRNGTSAAASRDLPQAGA